MKCTVQNLYGEQCRRDKHDDLTAGREPHLFAPHVSDRMVAAAIVAYNKNASLFEDDAMHAAIQAALEAR